jgi:DNA-binding GntR family transcriptional regulator
MSRQTSHFRGSASPLASESQPTPLGAIKPLALSDRRNATISAHAYIRELICSNALPAGTTISQVELSKALGVSRTPLREALRMLQEEGLIEAEANRRCRVAGFFPEDLDAVYGSRLMLETLGMQITLPQLKGDEIAAIDDAFLRMEQLARVVSLGNLGPSPAWREAHRFFHCALTARAPRALLDQIEAQTERSERYVMHYFMAMVESRPFDSVAKIEEHREILSLIRAGRFSQAIVAHAQHRARTALSILVDVGVDYEPVAIRAALRCIASEAGTMQRSAPRTKRFA